MTMTANRYGLTRAGLPYILDPADVQGPDFPGEAFRMLKEKEIAKFDEYRTRRLVLEAWDRAERGEKGDTEMSDLLERAGLTARSSSAESGLYLSVGLWYYATCVTQLA